MAEIDIVAEAEHDDLLRLFGHGEERTVRAERWLAEQVGTKETAMALHDMEGFDEVIRKLLGKLPPEAVLSAYKPKQVLAACKRVLADHEPEDVLLALPVEVLRGLSDAYLDTLPEPTRAAVRARIAETRGRAKPGTARKPGRARRRAAGPQR